jgi:hypothetical protein
VIDDRRTEHLQQLEIQEAEDRDRECYCKQPQVLEEVLAWASGAARPDE